MKKRPILLLFWFLSLFSTAQAQQPLLDELKKFSEQDSVSFTALTKALNTEGTRKTFESKQAAHPIGGGALHKTYQSYTVLQPDLIAAINLSYYSGNGKNYLEIELIPYEINSKSALLPGLIFEESTPADLFRKQQLKPHLSVYRDSQAAAHYILLPYQHAYVKVKGCRNTESANYWYRQPISSLVFRFDKVY